MHVERRRAFLVLSLHVDAVASCRQDDLTGARQGSPSGNRALGALRARRTRDLKLAGRVARPSNRANAHDASRPRERRRNGS